MAILKLQREITKECLPERAPTFLAMSEAIFRHLLLEEVMTLAILSLSTTM